MNTLEAHEEEYEKAKIRVTREQVARIENCANPTVATDQISAYDISEACAIIDAMIPLGAAFILHVLSKRAQYGNSKAREIVVRAEKLRINGVNGLCSARDEMRERTGVFLV